jgi:hypothetical protein
MARTGGTDGGARSILLLTLIGAVGGLYFVGKVQLGESEPGSPLLHTITTTTCPPRPSTRASPAPKSCTC